MSRDAGVDDEGTARGMDEAGMVVLEVSEVCQTHLDCRRYLPLGARYETWPGCQDDGRVTDG